MLNRTKIIFLSLVVGIFIFLGIISTNIAIGQTSESCDPMGWFPAEFGLKDHSVFYFDGFYYLVSIYLPGEQFFAYGRSTDLCYWEDLTPVLDQRTDEWDSLAIWAPHVFEEDGVYYMYYTGVKGPYPYLTQSIMLATTTNPAEPESWEQQGVVFQPDHLGMVWQDNTWSDCRDPMVSKQGNIFYLFYTGRDIDGGIVGIATASTLDGSWDDFGSILTLDTGSPESPFIWQDNGVFYLVYNHTGLGELSGEKYHFGPTPAGPWSDELPLSPGWAHEIWSGMDGRTYTSYLTNYTVTIQPLLYNTRYNPPRLFIGEQIVEQFLPIVLR